MLHLLTVLWFLFPDSFAVATKNDEDPHYREMNKQVRNNAGLTLLLKEDLQVDDFAKSHGRVMDTYHELLVSAFKRTGIKSFDYSCSVREGFERYHAVKEVTDSDKEPYLNLLQSLPQIFSSFSQFNSFHASLAMKIAVMKKLLIAIPQIGRFK